MLYSFTKDIVFTPLWGAVGNFIRWTPSPEQNSVERMNRNETMIQANHYSTYHSILSREMRKTFDEFKNRSSLISIFTHHLLYRWLSVSVYFIRFAVNNVWLAILRFICQGCQARSTHILAIYCYLLKLLKNIFKVKSYYSVYFFITEILRNVQDYKSTCYLHARW